MVKIDLVVALESDFIISLCRSTDLVICKWRDILYFTISVLRFFHTYFLEFSRKQNAYVFSQTRTLLHPKKFPEKSFSLPANRGRKNLHTQRKRLH